MPFGLNIEPRNFSKLSAVLLPQLREMGILCFVYLDDWLVAARSREESVVHTEVVLRVLSNAGFIINRKKSTLVPTRSIVWLGWTGDTEVSRLTFPSEKV